MMIDAVTRVAQRDGAAATDELLRGMAATLSGISVAVLGGERAIDLLRLTLYGVEQTAAKAAKARKRKRKRKRNGS